MADIQIKPENVLVSKDKATVKLCDFGVSEMFAAKGNDTVKKAGGSPAFLSPESFDCMWSAQVKTNLLAAHEVHGTAVDIWALGMSMFAMMNLLELTPRCYAVLHVDWSFTIQHSEPDRAFRGCQDKGVGPHDECMGTL